jgi:hypothetical protein
MSKLRAAAFEDTAASGISVLAKYITQGSAKAWATFTEITTTTLNGSLNVTSLTDGGTGTTTVNLTAAMASTSYANNWTANSWWKSSNSGSKTVSAFQGLSFSTGAFSSADLADCSAAVQGTLA